MMDVLAAKHSDRRFLCRYQWSMGARKTESCIRLESSIWAMEIYGIERRIRKIHMVSGSTWYHFDANGWMQNRMVIDREHMASILSSGAMIAGRWQWVNGNAITFDTNTNGYMMANTWVGDSLRRCQWSMDTWKTEADARLESRIWAMEIYGIERRIRKIQMAVSGKYMVSL